MMKKNSKMMSVSLSSGMAENRAYISTFKPLTLEIVFRGLMTLKVLSEPRENSWLFWLEELVSVSKVG